MVFSAVFRTLDTATGIGLANPEVRTAHVAASLYSEGKLVDIREFEIPAYGHRAWILNELFQSNVAAGHVEVESDVGLVGLQEFSQSHQWSAVPMQLVEENPELVFPVPPLGEYFGEGIALANSDESDLHLTLTAWGKGLDPVAGPVERVVKPHGELITLVSDLFGDFPLTGGFISVTAETAPAISSQNPHYPG